MNCTSLFCTAFTSTVYLFVIPPSVGAQAYGQSVFIVAEITISVALETVEAAADKLRTILLPDSKAAAAAVPINVIALAALNSKPSNL